MADNKTLKKVLSKYENRKSKSVEVSIGFMQGCACAVAKLILMHGCDTQAIDLFRNLGLKFSEFELYNIDPYDIEILTPYRSQLETI